MPSWLLVTITFLVSAGLYLLLAGQVSSTEIAAGIPAACAIAAFAALQHRGQKRIMRLRAPWHRVLFVPLLSLMRDSARVGGVLAQAIVRSPLAGTTDRQPFRSGGDAAADAGRRAIVTLASSFAPNGFVVDIAPSILLGDAPALLMHRLAVSAPSQDMEWPL